VLVAASVCPHPPLLVPETMGAAGWPQIRTGPEAEAAAASQEARVDQAIWQLRAACFTAVRDLADASPDLIVVVGGGTATKAYPDSAAGSLRDLGVPFTTGSGAPVLPLALTVGSWLIRRCLDLGTGGAQPGMVAQRAVRVGLQEVARDWPVAECLSLGGRLASAAPRVALLGMGDGSARKAMGVPGAADPAAERYDAQVAEALASADAGTLGRLDPRLDDELVVAGRAVWQVLAGAAGAQMRGQLRYAAAPLDVSYFVASWRSP
jgi:hypothetical protein